MNHSSNLLLEILLAPKQALQLSEQSWDVVVSQARRTNLLARLAASLAEEEVLEQISTSPKRHLSSALLMSERQDRAMRFEIDCIRLALRGVKRPVILLKGAAYLAAGLPNARGRMFGDVDILVPSDHLIDTESDLLIHGWKAAMDSAYDQKYYRTWMHEIPPLEHILRKTVIDVHHTILPRTARIKINIEPFFQSAIPLGRSGMHILCPEDMVLHSAAHLFHEGEFDNALRDLMDLHTLITHFSKKEGFWTRIQARAELTGLTRPLFYALRYCQRLLRTNIPESAITATQKDAPLSVQRKLIDLCYLHALHPLESRQSQAVRWSRFLLYLRSHWLKMPLHLLTQHLARKAFLRLQPTEKTEPNI